MTSWIVILSKHLESQQRARRDPLSDPLDGSDWDGLGWAVRLLCRLGRSDRSAGREEADRRGVRPFAAAGEDGDARRLFR